MIKYIQALGKHWLLSTSILLAITLMLIFAPLLGMNNTANAVITIIVGFAFTLVHGSIALGWKNLLAFLVITVVVSFSSEAIGVATGYVFGNYYYSDLLGPKILGVPPFIQMAYVAMGYASLMTARVILGFTNQIIGKWSLLAVTFIGTLLMVAWDVGMDPYQSTVSGDWLWQEGGPYFGVGIHNYVGWFVTVFIFMFLYQSYEKHFSKPVSIAFKSQRLFWNQVVLYYALIALDLILIPIVAGVSLTYASPAKYSGTPEALEYSLSLITFFVMGTPAIIAFVRLWLE